MRVCGQKCSLRSKNIRALNANFFCEPFLTVKENKMTLFDQLSKNGQRAFIAAILVFTATLVIGLIAIFTGK